LSERRHTANWAESIYANYARKDIVTHCVFMHDLHELEGSGIADVFGMGQLFVNFAYAGEAPLPQDTQDLQFAFSRFYIFGS